MSAIVISPEINSPHGLDLEKALIQLGKFGRYQWGIYVLLSLTAIPAVWHILSGTLIGGLPSHHCLLRNDTTVAEAIPTQKDTEKLESCLIYSDKRMNNSTIKCPHGWEYGNEFGNTIVTEWNLVCDNEYLIGISNAIFMLGVMCGGFIFTVFSDKYGRKPCLIVSIFLFTITGLLVAVSNSFQLFIILRFFNGICQQGFALLAVTMSGELLATEYRHLSVFLNNFFWAIGVMSLSGLGYLVQNWRYLQIIISMFLPLFLIYIKVLPESLPWLVAHGREELAREILMKAAKINGVTLDADVLYLPQETIDDVLLEEEENREKPFNKCDKMVNQKSKTKKTHNLIDIFYTPYLRIYALIMFYMWFVSSLTYFGLSMSTAALNGNTYINNALSGLIEIPACFIPVMTLNTIGRKFSAILTLVVAGVPLVLFPLIPSTLDPDSALAWTATVLSLIGRFGAVASYQIIIIYSVEIFPTVVRGSGMGTSNFFAGIAGVVAPFVLDLGRMNLHLTYFVLGLFPIVAAVLSLLLPETKHLPLLDYLEEYHRMPIVNFLRKH